MTDFEMDQPEKQKGVSRRTVTKAMAWAVPAVAIAAPVPAFALSGTPPRLCAGVACKLPGNSCDDFIEGLDGNKGFAFPFRITNRDSKPIYVYTIVIAPFADKTFDVVNALPAGPLAPGATLDATIYANGSDSSQNGGSTTVTFTWGHTPVAADDTEHAAIVVPLTVDPFGVCKDNWSIDHGSDGGWYGQNTCDPAFYDDPYNPCVPA